MVSHLHKELMSQKRLSLKPVKGPIDRQTQVKSSGEFLLALAPSNGAGRA